MAMKYTDDVLLKRVYRPLQKKGGAFLVSLHAHEGYFNRFPKQRASMQGGNNLLRTCKQWNGVCITQMQIVSQTATSLRRLSTQRSRVKGATPIAVPLSPKSPGRALARRPIVL